MAAGQQGPLDTRTTAEIDADNKKYLKAVAEMEKADARAAAKRDTAIAKELADQGQLTEEAFRTARAREEDVGAISKAFGFLGDKAKEFGTGVIGNIVNSLGMGLIGDVGSIVQQAFAPPTDEDLAQFAKAHGAVLEFADGAFKVTTELGAWEEALRRASAAEIEIRKATALAAEVTKGYAETIEDLTHGGELELLRRQLELANAQWLVGGMNTDAAGAAVRRYRAEIEALEADAKKNTAAVSLLTGGLIGGVGGSGTEQSATARAADDIRRKAAAARSDAAQRQWVQANIGDPGAEGVRIRALLAAEAQQRAADEEARAADEQRVAMEARAGTGDFYARADASAKASRAEQLEKQREQLQTMFGEASPFRGIDLITRGFDALTESAGAAFDALISGSESAGAAFMNALGGMLKSDAIHAGVQAIKEGAWALGSLAFGDAKGAALHAASATQWALTAAAAGAGAALLGAGGGGGGGGAGSGSGSGAGAGAGGGGGLYGSGAGGDPNRGTERVIVVGDAHGSSSPRFEAVKARRYASLAGASSDRVRYE